MAIRKILVSDKSGEEIREGDGAKLVVNYADRRRGRLEADLTTKEVEDLIAPFARKSNAPGPRVKSTNSN